MTSCVSCKNRDSLERCPNKAITGLTFCGKHVRAPTKRVWYIENSLDVKVSRIQACWRGYIIRTRLKLAGPGVLQRSICHNDEDVVSFEHKSKQNPFEYFAFEEDGKIWWFDILSILGCLNSNLVPTNPYTRRNLSIDTRRRLREIYKYRIHNRLPIAHSPMQKKSYNELIEIQWMKISQVLEENGFEGVHPNHFLSLTKTKLFAFLNFLLQDMAALAMEHPKSSRRYRWLAAIKRERDMFMNNPHAAIQLPTLIFSLTNAMHNPYPLCFSVMSALYRV